MHLKNYKTLISKLIPTYFKGVNKNKKLVGRRSVDEEFRTSEKPSESRSQPSTLLFLFFCGATYIFDNCFMFQG